MPLSELPIEVLSHITSLIPAAFHPPQNPLSSTYETLDPQPPIAQTPLNTISATCKVSHKLLEASRPWLWENVDVRSGRGWMAVVDALTEEVVDVGEDEVKMDSVLFGIPTPISFSTRVQPVSPEEAHSRPMTITSNFHRYITTPITSSSSPSASSSSYPNPYPFAISTPSYLSQSYSPPHAPIHQLLTPTDSPSPSPIFTNNNINNNNTTTLPRKASPSPRLRARSRSPRRTIGFNTEGITAVLERSRSASGSVGSWPRGISRERRRSSLSRTRTWSDGIGDSDDDDNNEEDDEVMDLPGSVNRYGGSKIPPTPSTPGTELDDLKDGEEGAGELLPPPGPYIRGLTFTNFRTIGGRRTQDEAIRGRFVTAGRLEGVVKNAPNLVSLCMTEYVDSSLSYSVLEELFFRGYKRPRHTSTRARSQSISFDPNLIVSPATTTSQLEPNRPTYVPYEDETEDQKWKRRAMFTPLEALDLTGCVSSVFGVAMIDFWERWLADEEETWERPGRGRSRHRSGDVPSSTEDEEDDPMNGNGRAPERKFRRTPRFPAMKRLSLRACTTLNPPLLHDLILAFPNLTHLDLSGTRVPTTLLDDLTDHPRRGMRLQSLSLARCPRLGPGGIVDFLCDSPVVSELIELNLYVNPTQGSAIKGENLTRLLGAPCLKSGNLRYLDLSSCGFTPEHMLNFPPQPNLLSLGLSHIPQLPLESIATFLLNRAQNVEILTLTGTSTSSLNPKFTSLQITLELHGRLINPLTSVPFSLSSLSLSPSGPDMRPGPTHLRVIELSSPIRHALSGGANSVEWKVVRSKGGRGWYVDLSAGWAHNTGLGKGEQGGECGKQGGGGQDGVIGEDEEKKKFVRHLSAKHERRVWMQGLADANGRVGSGVGWHSRKMEIVRGMGMLGREEGMAGVGAFAFDE